VGSRRDINTSPSLVDLFFSIIAEEMRSTKAVGVNSMACPKNELRRLHGLFLPSALLSRFQNSSIGKTCATSQAVCYALQNIKKDFENGIMAEKLCHWSYKTLASPASRLSSKQHANRLAPTKHPKHQVMSCFVGLCGLISKTLHGNAMV